MNALREWLVEKTLPVWLARGIDHDCGGFHEKLAFDLTPVVDEGKRAMVQARQCYVFAGPGAHLSGASAAAKDGFEFLRAHCRHPDGGWRHRTQRNGAPLDDTRELYDQAFVIFAASWMIATYGVDDVRVVADETLDYLEHDRSHPAGGYTEAVCGDGSLADRARRQNPHMHLFEALLALYDATGEDRCLERAAHLCDLVCTRFMVDGTLREYFTEDLEPAPGEKGRIVEPGHHMEWVWLLHRYARLSGDRSAVQTAESLYAFALANGYDIQSGGVIDEVTDGGQAIKESRRLWPQTEALKGHVARYRHTGDASTLDRVEKGVAMLMQEHLNERDGGWREHLDSDGINFYGSYPASTLYHLAFAVAELEQLHQAVGR